MSSNSRRTIRSFPKEIKALDNIKILKEMHLDDISKCISSKLKKYYSSIEDFRKDVDKCCIEVFYFTLGQIGWNDWQVESLLSVIKKSNRIKIGK